MRTYTAQVGARTRTYAQYSKSAYSTSTKSWYDTQNTEHECMSSEERVFGCVISCHRDRLMMSKVPSRSFWGKRIVPSTSSWIRRSAPPRPQPTSAYHAYYGQLSISLHPGVTPTQPCSESILLPVVRIVEVDIFVHSEYSRSVHKTFEVELFVFRLYFWLS